MSSFEKIYSPKRAKKRKLHLSHGLKAVVPVAVLGTLIRAGEELLAFDRFKNNPFGEKLAIDLDIVRPIYKRMERRNSESWKRWRDGANAEEERQASERQEQDGQAEALAGDAPAKPLATLGDALENARPTRW